MTASTPGEPVGNGLGNTRTGRAANGGPVASDAAPSLPGRGPRRAPARAGWPTASAGAEASPGPGAPAAQDRTKHTVPKIWEDGGLLFGYSGNTAVMDPLQAALHEALDGKDTSQSRWTVKALLCATIGPLIAGEYKNYVPAAPEGQVPVKLAGSLLVIGKDNSGYWLLDVDHNNIGTFHQVRGFHAIGSGSHAAQVARGLLEHYALDARTVWHLKLIAHRTVDTCIRVLERGVGGEVQLWASTEDPAGFAKVEGEAMDEVTYGVEQWTLAERESLDDVLGTGPAAEPAEEQAEAPEELDEDDDASAKAAEVESAEQPRAQPVGDGSGDPPRS